MPPPELPLREPPPPSLSSVPSRPVATAAAPAANLPYAPTALGECWAGVVAMLAQRGLISALVRELAFQAELLAQEDGAAPLWRLRVERESLAGTALADKLRGALAEGLGIGSLRLEVERGATADTPARRDAAERERRQREAEALIHADPLVQEMLAQFSTARIVPGSIKPQ